MTVLILCLSGFLNLCVVNQPPSLPFGVLVEGTLGSTEATCTVSLLAPDGMCSSETAPCDFLGGVIGGCFGLPCEGGPGADACWLYDLGPGTPPEGHAYAYAFD